jgi:large subunit ribosomal protein L9
MKEKIILQSDVEHLGLAGEMVEVAKGYARNYLLPKKLALAATPANEKLLADMMATVAERKMKQEEAARAHASRLEEVQLTVLAKVGESGRLFGSVTSMNIAEALAEAGHEIDRRRIDLKSPIKAVGIHEVPVKLEAGVIATIKVEVANENKEEAEAEAVARAQEAAEQEARAEALDDDEE